MAIEIERKFLILRPEPDKIASLPGARVRRITQTYLKKIPGKSVERRVRRIEEDGQVSYVFTKKEKLTKMSRIENEWEITEAEYREALTEAYSALDKTRYSFPWENHVMEIDVYPYEIGGDALEGYAVLEVELADEEEPFAVPDFLSIERELTGTKEFSNKNLAKRL